MRQRGAAGASLAASVMTDSVFSLGPDFRQWDEKSTCRQRNRIWFLCQCKSLSSPVGRRWRRHQKLLVDDQQLLHNADVDRHVTAAIIRQDLRISVHLQSLYTLNIHLNLLPGRCFDGVILYAHRTRLSLSSDESCTSQWRISSCYFRHCDNSNSNH